MCAPRTKLRSAGQPLTLSQRVTKRMPRCCSVCTSQAADRPPPSRSTSCAPSLPGDSIGLVRQDSPRRFSMASKSLLSCIGRSRSLRTMSLLATPLRTVLVQPAQVRPRGLRRHEPRMPQRRGGVVHEDDQRAAQRPVFEPRMRAAVDLHQFAHRRASRAKLKHALAPHGLVLPQPGFDHPAAQRLAAVRKGVMLHQVLACQRWPEVRVALADQIDPALLGLLADAPPARPAAALAHQAGCTAAAGCRRRGLAVGEQPN